MITYGFSRFFYSFFRSLFNFKHNPIYLYSFLYLTYQLSFVITSRTIPLVDAILENNNKGYYQGENLLLTITFLISIIAFNTLLLVKKNDKVINIKLN